MEGVSVMAEIFTGLGTFITSIFGAIGSGLTAIAAEEILSMYVIYIPLFGLILSLIFGFVAKPKRRD